MITRQELQSYLAELLAIDSIRDYAPNGLQVQGREQIKTIVTGVSASLALLERAIAEQADAIIVHHGYFWKNECPTITGMRYQRIKTLLQHDINLFAYHLPLDVHEELGNNAQLAQRWGVEVQAVVAPDSQSPPLLFIGEFAAPVSAAELSQTLSTTLSRDPLHLPGNRKDIQRLVWCSGGGQSFFDAAIELGADAYISGEVSEKTFHTACESGVHYFAAGHHATERFGVQAVGLHLAERFGLSHVFVDIDNPV